jgi:hypothetical protein
VKLNNHLKGGGQVANRTWSRLVPLLVFVCFVACVVTLFHIDESQTRRYRLADVEPQQPLLRIDAIIKLDVQKTQLNLTKT